MTGTSNNALLQIRAARAGFGKWSAATPYNRGQVLYRLAEMLESRLDSLAAVCDGAEEVGRTIDLVVWYAGWADKYAQVLGGSNPVAGPYFNFTSPEPTGVVGVVAPEEPALEGLAARVAPALVSGNSVVVIASETSPLAAIEFAEAVATCDLPPGALNVLTGPPDELASVLAAHLDVNGLDLSGAEMPIELERLAADGVKRVRNCHPLARSLADIEAFVEHKTVWHPVGF